MAWHQLFTWRRLLAQGASPHGIKYGHVRNFSPKFRPTQPSLDNGPVQRRVRRTFIATGKPVLSTSEIVEWSHPHPGTDWHHARRSVRRVCERYCVRVGQGTQLGCGDKKKQSNMRLRRQKKAKQHATIKAGTYQARTADPPNGRSIIEIELAEAQESGKPALAFLLPPHPIELDLN
jgi:hypothetical protein